MIQLLDSECDINVITRFEEKLLLFSLLKGIIYSSHVLFSKFLCGYSVIFASGRKGGLCFFFPPDIYF